MSLAPSVELKVAALYDCWAFIDLISYHDGTKNFDQCHFDFLLVLSAPQYEQSGHLVGDLRKRWQYLVGEDVKSPTPARMLKFPRGHFKSTLIIAWMMWRIYRNPNITILHATNVRELSEAFIRELRSYYEDDYLQAAVWNSRPHIRGNLVPPLDRTNRRMYRDNESEDKKIVWSNYQLQMLRDDKRKEPTVLSTSVQAKSTGQHYDIAVFDDIVDFANSDTELKIRRVKRWAADIASVITQTPRTASLGVTPDGTRITETTMGEYVVTGTHYNPNDYYVFVEQNKKALGYTIFSRNIYANGVDDSEGYLWSKFTSDTEAKLRAQLSESPGVFEAQYLNSVNNIALQILSTSLIQYVPQSRLVENLSSDGGWFTHPATQEVEYFTPILTIDPAISLRASADFTAICVGGRTTADRLAVCEFPLGHFTPEHTVAEVIRLIKRWGVRIVYCETVSFQSLLRKMVLDAVIKEKLKCAVLEYSPVKWGNKLKRIEVQLSPYFSNGRVVFADVIKNDQRLMNTFNFFGRGGRDDAPDALAVLAEKSIPPLGVGFRRTYPGLNQRHSNNSFNTRFGGIY